MTNNQLTPERISDISDYFVEMQDHYSDQADRENFEIFRDAELLMKELQERRKADSEPVATLDVQSRRPDGNKFALVFSSAAHKLPDDVYFLYRHAQPAPVVPEEATPDSIEILASGRCRDHVVYQWDEDQRNAAADSWNACRAAMLEADPQLPGSDSAPVPGSWIPVSERMPPPRYEVLVGRWWGEKPRWCCKWATYIPGHPDSQSSGWLIPGASWTPTHWMPLPAAPQEPKP
ncbi:hypothetical protein SK92_00279 [Klebsiella oxytoca]|uniref:DUF551 domain-containing protein n=1 Tax=Klebsiella oxytoca TaxID=571 RepID=UPI000659378F|nr:DUF551 domain-containing protein [Klebsiella oxytoca]KLY37145.1 hypothetical protein SK92_00279 [Klebsiella oxytoca]